MRNSNKAQATLFIIIGLVLIIGAGTVFYVRTLTTEKPLGAETFKQAKLPQQAEIKTYLNTYLQQALQYVSPELIRFIGENGGTLAPLTPYSNSRLHYNIKYRYLCEYQQEKGCVNNLVLRQDMEQELNEAIKAQTKKYIDLNNFREQGYTVEEGEMQVITTIGAENVDVRLIYPLKISKEDYLLEANEFSSTINAPLGKLYDLAIQILNEEITQGRFDKDEWMDKHGAEIKIQKHKPYPDTVYELKTHVEQGEEDYLFYFAIKGDDTVEKIGSSNPNQLYDYCSIEKDNNCYANSIKAECESKGGTYSSNPKCGGLAVFKEKELCSNRTCRDCEINGVAKKHGDTWCVYDSIVGMGFDRVGTRHYLQSCIDGELYIEECRDYRDEICAQPSNNVKAVCRVNRWQDCSHQASKQSCEDSTKRDCFWNSWVTNTQGVATGSCHPYVPPGFKFWKGQNQDVCDFANDMGNCVQTEMYCRSAWADSSTALCYSEGDCGNYRNVAGQLTEEGSWNSEYKRREMAGYGDGFPPDWLYFDPYLNPSQFYIPLRTDVYNKAEGVRYSPAPTDSQMKSFENAYGEEVSSWKACNDGGCSCGPDTFECKCYVNVLGCCVLCAPSTPKLYTIFRKYIIGTNYCDVWQAPQQGNCNFCEVEPLKPCTEYRCKSLGKNCIYKEDASKGIGHCYDIKEAPELSQYREPLKIGIDLTTIPQGYSAAGQDDLMVGLQVISGNIISPSIPVGTDFKFNIITNRESACAASLLPFKKPGTGQTILEMGLNSIISTEGLENKGKIHTIRLDTSSPEARVSQLMDALKMQDPIQFASDNTQIYGMNYSLSEAAGENKDISKYLITTAVARTFHYFVTCADSFGKESAAFIRYSLDTADLNPPVIQGAAPADNSASASPAVFTFTPQEDISERIPCALWYGANLTNMEKQSSAFAYAGKQTTIIANFPGPGAYKWKIQCSDGVNAAETDVKTIIIT